MLKINDVQVAYGGIRALHGVSLEIKQGEIVTLIGCNGAGKTTLLRAVSGLVQPVSGSMTLSVNDASCPLVRLRPDEIVRLGIAHVPEGRMVFPNLTVKENLELGAFLRKNSKEVSQDFDKIFSFFPRLHERLKQLAGTLSGGEQQMLAIGRALMARPRLILMDEPSLGLAPILVKGIFEKIQQINAQGITILLVEQNAHMALKISHRGYVLETGRIVLEGTRQQLESNDEIRKAYLGG
jgi:branched-chain amino acid transport system ATP-binding protein